MIKAKIPMGYALRKFGKAGMGEFLTGFLARELPSEQAATLTQDAVDTAIANPDKTWGEYWAERPAAAYQTLLATAVQSGAMGAAHGGAHLAKQHYIDQIEPTYNPKSALGRALLQDINDIAFNPDAIDQQARNALDPGNAQLTQVQPTGPLSRAASRVAPPLVPSSPPPSATSEQPGQPSAPAAPVSPELQAILGGINQIDPADAAVRLQQQIDAQNPESTPNPSPVNPDWADELQRIKRDEAARQASSDQADATPTLPSLSLSASPDQISQQSFPDQMDTPEPVSIARPAPPETPKAPDILRTNGTPFKNEQTARTAAKNRRLVDHMPVQVDGGWALRKVETAPAPSVETPPARNAGDRPPTLGEEISGIFNQIAQGMGDASREAAVDRFQKEGGLTYRHPEAIRQAKQDPGYHAVENADGSLQVIGLLDPRTNAWVGQAPPPRTSATETQTESAPPAFTPTHILSDGTPAREVSPGIYLDANGIENQDADATPITQPPEQAPTTEDTPDEKTHALSNVRTAQGKSTDETQGQEGLLAPPDAAVPAPQNQVAGTPIVEVPLANLSLSPDVPQFKDGANADGVVEPLGGTFDRRGIAPIQVWERADGRQEVISGRHRLDLARRSGEQTIPAQIHREADGLTATQARSLDAELNIRDGQGKAIDYVDYFQARGITPEQASQEGLVARNPGKRGHTLATHGSEPLIAQVRAGAIPDTAAEDIALAAPGNAPLQAVAINQIVNQGVDPRRALATMQAVQAMTAGRQAANAPGNDQGDLFGFDDSQMREAERMGTVAAQKQADIARAINAISGASKNPKLAAQHGVDVKDPQSVQATLADLKAQQRAWSQWPTNPDLVNQVRGEMGGETDASPTVAADAAPTKTKGHMTLEDVLRVAKRPDRSGNDAFHIYRKVDQAEADTIKQAANLDVSGFEHGIDEAAIRHVLNHHGNSETESARGQVAITLDDFVKIPEITDPSKADEIDYNAKTEDGLPAIHYKKRYNGHVIVVEEVRTGRKRLALKTMWKTRSAPSVPSEKGRSPTPETFGAQSSDGTQSLASGATEGKPKLPPPTPDITRTNGQPFKDEQTAKTAAKNRRLTGHVPVQVDGGWVLRKADQAETPAATTESAPMVAPDPSDQPADAPTQPPRTDALAAHDAIAQEYGYQVREDGTLVKEGGKESSLKVVKGQNGRFQVRTKRDNAIVFSGANTQSIAKFLKDYWYAEKKPAPSPETTTPKPQVETQKEPWQMTRDEVVALSGESRKETAANHPYRAVNKETGETVREIPGRLISKVNTDKYRVESMGYPLDPLEDNGWVGNAEARHHHDIQQAIADGKPVPAHVLADYPDLVAKAKTTQAPTAPEISLESVTPDGETTGTTPYSSLDRPFAFGTSKDYSTGYKNVNQAKNNSSTARFYYQDWLKAAGSEEQAGYQIVETEKGYFITPQDDQVDLIRQGREIDETKRTITSELWNGKESNALEVAVANRVWKTHNHPVPISSYVKLDQDNVAEDKNLSAAGLYVSETKNLYVQNKGHVDTLFHELGHAIHDILTQKGFKPSRAELRSALKAMFGDAKVPAYSRSTVETTAEFNAFAHFHPDAAQKAAPQLFDEVVLARSAVVINAPISLPDGKQIIPSLVQRRAKESMKSGYYDPEYAQYQHDMDSAMIEAGADTDWNALSASDAAKLNINWPRNVLGSENIYATFESVNHHPKVTRHQHRIFSS